MAKRKLKWLVEFSVDLLWVADGFDPRGQEGDQMFKDMLADKLGWAYENELGAKIIKAPDQAKVKRIQGYE